MTDPITICYPMAGDSLGGSHHSLLGLIEGLDRTRFRPIMILEKPSGRLAEHFSSFEQIADPAPPSDSFAVGRDFTIRRFASTFRGLRRRSALLRSVNATVVHTNDGRTHATWALATKMAGRKLLWHHRADPTAKGLRFVAPWVADHIVTVSHFSLPRRPLTAAARNAEVVFSPFETQIMVQPVRERLVEEIGASADTIICGYFGSFIDRKRPLMFIEAIAALKASQGRPVKGVMFGESTYPELEVAMRERIRLPDVSGSVHLMGYRSPGADWIAACDFLLVPAVDEPLGRTLVEAMLVGTPVVATRSGGNPEAILDGIGSLVPPGDPHAVAKACIELLDDPGATAAMTARAKVSAKDRFSSARHIDAITRIYERLAADAQ
ncbi:glycosyltransferase family 4 protein [Sphingopyxis sp.]|uniref:glycosyltransferase family 4 protein n=1 Tax=Sphingopyxis sp. TaxID=1908224 RepID=UPI003D0BB61B